MTIDFGIFDHMDLGGREPGVLFEERLRLLEQGDAAGLYGYHVAEHHQTPLGMASSPGIFLAALAQRTTRLRFGPLVYVLPLYAPLRLIDEICMLDQLSGGRFELGVGRGIQPFELGLNGVDHLASLEMYMEGLEVILAGFGCGLEGKLLDHHGKYYEFHNAPIVHAPAQRPHPPLWYAVYNNPEAAVWPARAGCNIAMLVSASIVRLIVERFTTEWRDAHGEKPLPRMGLTRFIHIAETDAQAELEARAAYDSWYENLARLWRAYHASPAHAPQNFDVARERESMIAGAPETGRAELARHLDESGCNYVLGQMFFGDLTFEAMSRSLRLLTDEVMPHFRTGD